MITRSDKPDDSKVTSQRIPVVFNNLARGKSFYSSLKEKVTNSDL